MEVIPLEHSHILALWEILKEYPDFFADDIKLDNSENLWNYLNNKDTLVGIKDGKVIGCAYLEDLHDGFACVALFTKRHSVKPQEMIKTLKENLSYYFEKHNLKMLYAVTRVTNRAVIRLFKTLGFKGFSLLPKFKEVNGKPVDYILAGIIKEDLKGGY